MRILARMIFQSCFPLKFFPNCKDCWHSFCRNSNENGNKMCWKTRSVISGHTFYLWLAWSYGSDSILESKFIQTTVPRLKAMTWNMANPNKESTDPAAVINLKVFTPNNTTFLNLWSTKDDLFIPFELNFNFACVLIQRHCWISLNKFNFSCM